MTKLLKKAFDEATRLPEDLQDWVAELLLTEIRTERKWDDLFERSPEVLANLATEALMEDESGETEDLDLDRM